MASGISTVVVAGNLTRDPELVSDRLLTFSVAVNRREKNRDTDEYEDVAHFFDCKVLGARAAALATFMVKGDKVTVQGDLVQERWEKDGEKRSAVRVIAREVVMGGKREDAPTHVPTGSGDLF